MKILAIETSCDETALALIEAKGGIRNPSFKILKNLVASQIKIHAPFGGVVPTLAKREHSKNLPKLFQKIFGISDFSRHLSEKLLENKIPLKKDQFLTKSLSTITIPTTFDDLKVISNDNIRKLSLLDIDLIAVTVGPGLEPCLWMGINFAKIMYADLCKLKRKLRRKKEIKLIGVNHLEGHLYSFLLNQKRVSSKYKTRNLKLFPAVAIIVSGGHTILLLMKDLVHFKKLGETRDDAAGESFDKVARLLNLPYPGGPEIEKIAKLGKTNINFPRPMISQKNYDFSFSGLKTAVYYYLKNLQFATYDLQLKADIASSFQQAVFDVLIEKTLKAVKKFKAKSVILTGGVSANKTLQKEFRKKIKNFDKNIVFFVPSKKYCTDNAAMVALAAYFDYLTKKKYPLQANGNLNIKK